MQLNEPTYEAEREMADQIMEAEYVEYWDSVDIELDNDADYQKWMEEQDEILIESIDSGIYLPPPDAAGDDLFDIVPY